jgi:NAD(P) transhydrogenase
MVRKLLHRCRGVHYKRTMLHFDVAIVGSGPAGERGATRAAFLGKKVAVIEKEAVPGGACANTGTIPSKALRETALALLQSKRRDVHGFILQVAETMTVAALMGRRGLVTAREHTRIRNRFSQYAIETFRGTASFLDANTLKVSVPDGSTQEIRAEVILIATGTRPFHPPGMPIDHSRVYDSDSILMLDRVPRSLAVLGGGVAGCEYTSAFAALGVHVTMADSRDRVMPFLDAELSHELERLWTEFGVEIKHKTRVSRVEPGDRDVLLYLTDGSRLVAEKVLVAAGRVGNVESLELEKAGLAADERGFLKVNPHFQTAVPHIYAAGDVVGFPGLASTSMEQGRVAMTYACEAKDFRTQLQGDVLPTGIYTLRGRQGQLRGERPRQPAGGGGGLGEAARVAEGPALARRARHRAQRRRGGAPGRGGDGAGRDLPLLHRGGLQLSDPGRHLQGRGLRRAQEAGCAHRRVEGLGPTPPHPARGRGAARSPDQGSGTARAARSAHICCTWGSAAVLVSRQRASAAQRAWVRSSAAWLMATSARSAKVTTIPAAMVNSLMSVLPWVPRQAPTTERGTARTGPARFASLARVTVARKSQ